MCQRTVLILLGALLAGPAAAQGAPPPQPPEPPGAAGIERVPTVPRRDFYLKPETERASRQSDAKMEAVQRRMDERVKRVTRSICAGCAGDSPSRRRGSAARDNKPARVDPAQAPAN